MPKLDRFERAVEKLSTLDHWNVPVVSSVDAIAALRNEHRWMERMVKQLEKEHTSPGFFYDGYTCALLKVLHLLEKRRK